MVAPWFTNRRQGDAGTPVGSMAFRLLRRLLLALVVVVAGLVLLVGLLVPIYAVAAPPASTLMLRDLVLRGGYERVWVPFEKISPYLVRSVIMSEDGRYCEHGGVDWDALNRVLDGAGEGGPSRGASTIAMQTVKNLFLWPSRSYLRKAVEIPLALYADVTWSKRRTIEIYLNTAEWGEGIFGAEAAANHYFGKPAEKLTRREAALLAAALPNPFLRNPGKPSRALARYAGTIEKRERQSGAYVKCVFTS